MDYEFRSLSIVKKKKKKKGIKYNFIYRFRSLKIVGKKYKRRMITNFSSLRNKDKGKYNFIY